MPLRKRPAGTRLQVLFEAACRLLRGELHRDYERPGTVIDCVTRWSAVVPFEPRVNVVGDADIVTGWIGAASDDVNEALLESMHDNRTGANVGPTQKTRK